MACNDAARDLNSDFILAILRVEMRWCVITVIHSDDDPEESGNFRHACNLGARRRTFNFFRRSWRSADASRLIKISTGGVTRIRWSDWF